MPESKHWYNASLCLDSKSRILANDGYIRIATQIGDMPYYGQPLNVKESSVISCLTKATKLKKETSSTRDKFSPNYLSEPEWRKKYPGLNQFPNLYKEAQQKTKWAILHKFLISIYKIPVHTTAQNI